MQYETLTNKKVILTNATSNSLPAIAKMLIDW